MQEIAAGLLVYHPKSKRILLGLRSDLNCWANFGGGFEPKKDKTIRETAIREFWEETMCDTKYNISKNPIEIHESNFLRYYTYLALFDVLFEPTINDEHKNYGWFKLNELPSNLLPEFKQTLDKNIGMLEKI